jgi:hypothetical protein
VGRPKKRAAEAEATDQAAGKPRRTRLAVDTDPEVIEALKIRSVEMGHELRRRVSQYEVVNAMLRKDLKKELEEVASLPAKLTTACPDGLCRR